MNLEELEPALLYTIVFGPGYGESIVIRIPPSTWIVVDSCRISGKSPAAFLLDQHHAEWSGAILTHPHLDHSLGMDEVFSHPIKGPIGCATEPSEARPDWIQSQDPEELLRSGTLQHVLSYIQESWRASPESRWLLRRGESRDFGEARITILHPDDAIVRDFDRRRLDPNRLSSPLLIQWEGVLILLGSDCLEKDWQTINETWPDLGTHSCYKVAHHGASGAAHIALKGMDRARHWVLTPFNRGSRLPRYGDREGLAWLLKCVDSVYMTALPVSHDLQDPTPFSATRQDLRDGKKPKPQHRTLPDGAPIAMLPSFPENPLACYVAAGFDKNGIRRDLRCGPGSVVVREKPKHRSRNT